MFTWAERKRCGLISPKQKYNGQCLKFRVDALRDMLYIRTHRREQRSSQLARMR